MMSKWFGTCMILLAAVALNALVHGVDVVVPDIAGNTGAGQTGISQPADKAQEQGPKSIEQPVYTKNNPLADFQIHFFISLPFTALYSYLAVSSMDAIVQGQYPTAFRTTNSWMIIGLAVGSSLAIALGNIGRVPDQSVPVLASGLNWQEAREAEPSDNVVVAEKMELLRILY